MPTIHYFTEDTSFKLGRPAQFTKWIKEVIKCEQRVLLELNFIFCSDQYLHNLNISYLAHDTLTDIVTFDNSEEAGVIEGDVFISIERVMENAAKFNETTHRELCRVMIHGVLHLLGYSDKSKAAKHQMREKEDEHLSLPSVPRET